MITRAVAAALLTLTTTTLVACTKPVEEDATGTTEEALVKKCAPGDSWQCDPDGLPGTSMCGCMPDPGSNGSPPPPPPPYALEVTAGLSSTCALTSDATVRCWGAGYRGPSVPIFSNVAHIAGYSKSNAFCVIMKDGTLNCQDPLGLTTITSAQDPTLVNVRAVALAEEDACAIVGDGSVRCWGMGHIPGGGAIGRSAPTLITGASSIAIAGWMEHPNQADMCAVVAGEVWCEGNAMYVHGLARAPVPAATWVVAGDDYFCTYALLGRASCWDGTGLGPSTPSTMTVPGLVSYTPGNPWDGGLSPDYSVDFAGDLYVGAFDRGVYVGATKLDSPSGLTAVSGGARHACGLQSGGNLFCWGDDSYGQLGGSSATVRVSF